MNINKVLNLCYPYDTAVSKESFIIQGEGAFFFQVFNSGLGLQREAKLRSLPQVKLNNNTPFKRIGDASTGPSERFLHFAFKTWGEKTTVRYTQCLSVCHPSSSSVVM